ncbi:DUF6098 family protein [Leucobacter japonicus]|uniref:DUF6098 family protein n=1 Tax=Leucobacter japonicus TaxID=1461259 RepID=UPI0006A7E9F9|nr:DUF6098 family protein [Leucobacter japonicus]
MGLVMPGGAADVPFDFGLEYLEPLGHDHVWVDGLAAPQTPDDDRHSRSIDSLYEVESLLRRHPQLHVIAAHEPSLSGLVNIDAESGLALPGVPTHPLQPEEWWYRPVGDWLARQITHLAAAPFDADALWLVSGRVVGRGPDGAPLLADAATIGVLGEAAIEEAGDRYHQRFAHAVNAVGAAE